jgi:hypothetical protein
MNPILDAVKETLKGETDESCALRRDAPSEQASVRVPQSLPVEDDAL